MNNHLNNLHWTEIIPSCPPGIGFKHATMLVLFADENQLLVSFKRPLKNVTIRELICLVGIPQPRNNKVFCMANTNQTLFDVHYVVTVGIDKSLSTIKLDIYNALQEPTLMESVRQNLREMDINVDEDPKLQSTFSKNSIEELLCPESKLDTSPPKTMQPSTCKTIEPSPSKSILSMNVSTVSASSAEKSSKLVAVEKWLDSQSHDNIFGDHDEEQFDPHVSVESKASKQYFKQMIGYLEQQKFVDCYFKFVKNFQGQQYLVEKVGAHRCSLANESENFKQILFSDLYHPVTVTVTDVDPKIFKKLLQIVYHESIEIKDPTEGLDLHFAARQYGCEHAKDYIVKVIQHNLKE